MDTIQGRIRIFNNKNLLFYFHIIFYSSSFFFVFSQNHCPEEQESQRWNKYVANITEGNGDTSCRFLLNVFFDNNMTSTNHTWGHF